MKKFKDLKKSWLVITACILILVLILGFFAEEFGHILGRYLAN